MADRRGAPPIGTRIAFDQLPTIICVAGSRDFPRRAWVTAFVDRLQPGTTIAHGCGPASPEEWAGVAAVARGLEVMTFPANWGRYGRSAGPRRNREMLSCVGAWGGVLVAFATQSASGELLHGPADAIRQAAEIGVPYHLIAVDADGVVTTGSHEFGPYLLGTSDGHQPAAPVPVASANPFLAADNAHPLPD